MPEGQGIKAIGNKQLELYMSIQVLIAKAHTRNTTKAYGSGICFTMIRILSPFWVPLAQVFAMIIMLTLWTEAVVLDEETKPHLVCT